MGSFRYVDADILDQLAKDCWSSRDGVAAALARCEGKVNGTPRRGWDTGAWDDIRNGMRGEISVLDVDHRALALRAGDTRVKAAVAALMEWLASAGYTLREHLPFGAQKPNALLAYVIGGPLIVPLGAAWVDALRRILDWLSHPDHRPAPLPSIPRPGSATAPSAIDEARRAELANWWKQNSGKGVGYRYIDKDGKDWGYQCVALAQDWAAKGLHRPTGPFDGGTAIGAWNASISPSGSQAFPNDQWERVSSGKGNYKPGDLVFFPAAESNGWAGHVAVVASVPDKDGNFTVYHQNYPTGSLAATKPFNVSDTLGVMRPL